MPDRSRINEVSASVSHGLVISSAWQSHLTPDDSSQILNHMLDQLDLDNVFRALADPGRRVMLERLTRGPATVTELSKPLDMSLTAVLQHVQVLEASGLVRSRKVGRIRTCRIEPAILRSAEAWISQRRVEIEQRLDRLDEYLARTADPPDAALGWLSLDNTDDESRENR